MDTPTPDVPEIRPYTIGDIARWYDVPPSLLATPGDPYRELFVCLTSDHNAEDEQPHDTCEWAFVCNHCYRRVSHVEGHCIDHAPMEFPGLRLAECTATPPHVLFGHDAEDYGLPCYLCLYNDACDRERLARQCRHWAWRRWPITRKAVHWLGMLGVLSGHTASFGDGHDWCVYDLKARGRRSHVLWVLVSTWHCWRQRHRRGEDIGFAGLCGKCMPWQCCGSTAYGHADGCKEST